MNLHRRAALTLSFATIALSMVPAATAAAPPHEVIALWPGKPPTAIGWSGAETSAVQAAANGGRNITVKSNVTEPTLTVFRPAKGKATGAAIIVMPGGAFGALAWDLEGTEVARWLAGRGVTAFVLKY